MLCVYKCTVQVYSVQCTVQGLGEDVSECLRSEGVSLLPTIIDIIQVQIGGCSAGRKQRTCSADDREWSGINMQH